MLIKYYMANIIMHIRCNQLTALIIAENQTKKPWYQFSNHGSYIKPIKIKHVTNFKLWIHNAGGKRFDRHTHIYIYI